MTDRTPHPDNEAVAQVVTLTPEEAAALYPAPAERDPNDFSEELMMVMAAISTGYDNIGQLGDPRKQVRFVMQLMSTIGFNMHRAFSFKDPKNARAFRDALAKSLRHGFNEGVKQAREGQGDG